MFFIYHCRYGLFICNGIRFSGLPVFKPSTLFLWQLRFLLR
jgi:hypothetical protein